MLNYKQLTEVHYIKSTYREAGPCSDVHMSKNFIAEKIMIQNTNSCSEDDIFI